MSPERRLREDDLHELALTAVLARTGGSAEDLGEAMRALDAHCVGRIRAWAARVPDPPVAARHTWITRRWARASAAHAGGGAPAAPVDIADLYARMAFPPRMARFHQQALDRLSALAEDTVRIQDLLHPDGDEGDVFSALAAYQDSAFSTYLNTVCGLVAAEAARGLDDPPRIVEVGGGAGVTTAAVLEHLGRASVDYWFTDVSRSLTTAARERLGPRRGLRFGRFDIDSDPLAQGALPASADLVVAANVLHNAQDTATALSHLRDLLAPGGLMAVVESVTDTPAVLTSMQFLLSHPTGAERVAPTDPRAGTDLVFLDTGTWRSCFAAAGLRPVLELPPEDSPLAAAGQRLFVLAADDTPPSPPPATGSGTAAVSRAVDTDVPDLAGRAARAAQHALAGVDPDLVLEARDLLDRATTGAMARALREVGALPVGEPRTPDRICADTAVAPGHRRLVRRWIRVLEASGHLEPAGGGRLAPADVLTAQESAAAWDRAARAWQAVAGAAETVGFARRCAQELPALLSGERSVVHLMFPEGRTELADALYREGAAARYQAAAAAEAVRATALAWRGGGPLRVLEIGAGTGVATDTVLPLLEGTRTSYTVTDVSPFFLEGARRRHGARPGVSFGRFDVDEDPGSQGYPPGSFDVVLGSGVLNAARDTHASLRHLAGVLAPGGRLVLTEPAREEPWVLLSQAFMMAPPEDERAELGTTFLSLDQWHRALDRAGFHRDLTLPAAEHPLAALGHHVFSARTGARPSRPRSPRP